MSAIRWIIAAVLVLTSLCSTAIAQEKALWDEYKAEFLSRDMRIIDRSQDGISHSEGQGYGMLLSVAFDDKETFDNIWRWTKYNLGVRKDNLFAWEFGKRPNGRWETVDYNNASDGDILIAYALLKASDKWPGGDYRAEGIRIVESIRKYLAVSSQGRTFILPGYDGFTKNGGIVLNPSYYSLPALRRFAQVDDRAFWDKVYGDALFIAAGTCFGELCLPADWVVLADGKVSVYGGKKPYFGAEAVRTLLYLSAEKTARLPSGAARVLGIYEKAGYLPEWVDLVNDGVSLKDSTAGYYAIYALAAKKLGKDGLSAELLNKAKTRLEGEKGSYYSFSLYLLAVNQEKIFQ